MKSPRFPDTRWSLVGRAAASRDGAFTELLKAYQPGLRRFLMEARRLSADEADDLLQDFIAEKMLARSLLSAADPERGKFRSFLLASLNNFVTSRLRGAMRQQARTVDLSHADDVAADPSTGLECFEREWVNQLVASALAAMEAECRAEGRPEAWEIFRLRVVEPALRGADPVDYAVLVSVLRLTSPRQAINLLAGAKRSFARHIRLAIARYVPKAEDVDRELADLREICLR